MFSFLTELETNLVVGVAALACGVIFSTKIKDYFKGIPAQARVALNSVEARAVADLKQAQADALSKLPGAAPAPKVALAPAASGGVAPAPAAPVAPVAPVAPPTA